MQMANPLHPGEIIREFHLEPLGLTVAEAADGLGVSHFTLSSLLNGKQGISPEMAYRLSKYFGPTPESWLSMQMEYDLAQARGRGNMLDLTNESIVTHLDDVLDHIRSGEVVSVLRQGESVAIMVQPEMWKELNRQLEFTKRVVASDANLSDLVSRNLYLTFDEIKTILKASGVELDSLYNLTVSPLDEKSATRIAATLYQRWESGKIQSIPWPEVEKKLQEMREDLTA